jgi:hypothetical protein
MVLSDTSVGMSTAAHDTGNELLWESWTPTVNSRDLAARVCKGGRGAVVMQAYPSFPICMARFQGVGHDIS